MHAETPTQSSYEPSHLMFMHQSQSRRGKLRCGIISNLPPLYVGSEYANKGTLPFQCVRVVVESDSV